MSQREFDARITERVADLLAYAHQGAMEGSYMKTLVEKLRVKLAQLEEREERDLHAVSSRYAAKRLALLEPYSDDVRTAALERFERGKGAK